MAELSREDAEEFTQALGQIVAGGWRQIAWADRQGIPAALGMSLQEWVSERIGGYVRLSLPERREAVKELTEQGMSTREIGAVLGVDQKTVNRDQRPEASASPQPGPEPEPQVEPEPEPEPEASASPEPALFVEPEVAAAHAEKVADFDAREADRRSAVALQTVVFRAAQRIAQLLNADPPAEIVQYMTRHPQMIEDVTPDQLDRAAGGLAEIAELWRNNGASAH